MKSSSKFSAFLASLEQQMLDESQESLIVFHTENDSLIGGAANKFCSNESASCDGSRNKGCSNKNSSGCTGTVNSRGCANLEISG
jgi:hypothetical protein